jgi:hypothetical protein
MNQSITQVEGRPVIHDHGMGQRDSAFGSPLGGFASIKVAFVPTAAGEQTFKTEGARSVNVQNLAASAAPTGLQ